MNEQDKKAIQNFRERIARGYKPSKIFYDPQTLSEQLKKDLCQIFNEIRSKYELNIQDLIFLTESSESQINEILNYRIESLSLDLIVEKIESLILNLKKNSINVEFSSVHLNSFKKQV